MLKQPKTIFQGFLIYALIIFIKDYYANLLYLMNSGFEEENLQIYGLLFQSGVLIVGALLFAYLRQRNPIIEWTKRDTSFLNILGIDCTKKTNVLCGAILGVLSFFAFNILKNFVLIISAYCGNNIEIDYINATVDLNFVLFLIIALGIWMPIGEEMVYRGMLFHTSLTRQNLVMLLPINVLVFAGAHDSVEQMIQAAFLGALLCFIAYKTRSISIGIVVHIFYNCTGIVVTYYFPLTLFKLFGVSGDNTPNQLLLSAARMLFVSILLVIVLILIGGRIVKPTITKCEEKQDTKQTSSFLSAILMMCIVVGYSIWKVVNTLIR